MMQQGIVVSESAFMLLVLCYITLDSWIRDVNINLLQVYPAADTYDPERDFFFKFVSANTRS